MCRRQFGAKTSPNPILCYSQFDHKCKWNFNQQSWTVMFSQTLICWEAWKVGPVINDLMQHIISPQHGLSVALKALMVIGNVGRPSGKWFSGNKNIVPCEKHELSSKNEIHVSGITLYYILLDMAIYWTILNITFILIRTKIVTMGRTC